MGAIQTMDGAQTDYANALVDSLITKASVAGRAEVSGTSEPLVSKCVNPATGEPVSARREEFAVLPVAGSVVESEDGNGKGSCPVCSTLVKLSGKGFVTAHTVRRVSIPVPKTRLAERMPAATESGARTGSADASERSRAAELSGVAGTGTVPLVVVVDGDVVKAKSPDPVAGTVELVMVEGVSVGDVDMGERKSRTVQVPATVDNLRTAIRQESRKKLRPEYAKGDTPSKCVNPATGEPVSARREEFAVLPDAGSVETSPDGGVTGTCPECRTRVGLSGKGFVTAHMRGRGEPTGRMVGGPDAALLARLNRMLKGATGLESVGVLGAEPGCYRVREAVDVDRASVDVTGGTGSARDERGVPVRGHKLNARVPSSPGTALVPGRSERPMVGEVSVRRVGESYARPADAEVPERERSTGKGKPRNAVGWSGPVGRERPDRVVIAGGDAAVCNGRKGKPCTVRGCVAVVGGQYGYMECHVFRAQSKAQQRRYWAHVATNEARDMAACERVGRERVVSRHPQHVTGKRVGAGVGVRRVTA